MTCASARTITGGAEILSAPPADSHPRAVAGASTSEPLSRPSISVLAAACGLAVANASYSQPLLVDMGKSLHLANSVVGLIPALTQLGVSAGILFFLLPLGDVVPARRLLTAAIIVQALALIATSLAPNETTLLAFSLLIGFFGITPYVLPPYATLRTPFEQRGRVTALLGQGVIVGMLLARSVSGVVGLHFGWRSVYAMAAVAMLLMLVPLRRTVRPAPMAALTAWMGVGRAKQA
jgi:predicted MFS family arabinose efflux permease